MPFSKRNGEHVLCGSISYTITPESLGELKKAVETLTPTAFLVLPNFHSCLYNSIETQYMFSIS